MFTEFFFSSKYNYIHLEKHNLSKVNGFFSMYFVKFRPRKYINACKKRKDARRVLSQHAQYNSQQEATAKHKSLFQFGLLNTGI